MRLPSSFMATVGGTLIATSAVATPVPFAFTQPGYDEGAVLSFSFLGEDLDGSGQIDSLVTGEVSNFQLFFSGNSLVPAFSMTQTDLQRVVYQPDGGPIFDTVTGAIEGLLAQNADFEVSAGPGPRVQCGTGVDCAEVKDRRTLQTSKSQALGLLGASGGGAPSTGLEPGSEVITSPMQSQTAPLTPTLITQRVGGWGSGGQSIAARGIELVDGGGLAAGDGVALPSAFWVSYSRVNLDNDLASTAFDATVSLFLGGADWQVTPRLLAGIAVGHERQDVTTTFNGGGQEVDGATFAGYLGFQVDDTFSVDAALGGSWFSTDQFRTLGGTRVTSEVDSTRVFAAVNGNGFWAWGRWQASARAGVLWAQDDFDAFTENAGVLGTVRNGERTVNLAQVSVGGDVGYTIGALVPFVSGRFVHDWRQTAVRVAAGQARPSGDRDEFQAGFGVRWFGADNGVSAIVEATTVQGREDIDNFTIAATVRIEL